MKCRKAAVLLAMLVSLTACGSDASSDASGVTPNTTYTGTIRAITEQSVTLSVENGDVTIELTASTAFRRDFGMGDMPGGMNGMPGGMNGMPGGMSGMPGGTGDMPGGMNGMPDGTGGMPGGMSGMPGGTGDMPGGTGGMPGGTGEIPGGTGEIPGGTGDMPGGTGDMPGDGANPPEKPDGEPGQLLTWSDLVVGDRVTVVTDAEGNAASVTVTVEGAPAGEAS